MVRLTKKSGENILDTISVFQGSIALAYKSIPPLMINIDGEHIDPSATQTLGIAFSAVVT